MDYHIRAELSNPDKFSALMIDVSEVGVGDFIRFALSTLQWTRDDKEGTIKYNTLTSSGAWSLEEIEIEELL